MFIVDYVIKNPYIGENILIMISIVYCTRESNPAHKEHLISSSGLHKHIEVIEIVNNGESLTQKL